MKRVADLIAELGRLGVQLRVEGNQLHCEESEDPQIAAYLSELRERESEVRDFLNPPQPSLPPISRVSRDGDLPLSLAQEKFLSLERLIPGNFLSNVFTAYRLSGALNIPTLKRTFDEIARRHEVLRTNFATLGGRPVQLISASHSLELLSEDLTALPEAEREAECVRRIIEEAQRPFDLASGPLLRPVLLALTGQDYLLLITMHHIITDAWSLRVLMSEMATLYAAILAERPPELPELAVQYADFAAWQRDLIADNTLAHHLGYWRKQLNDGDLPDFDLPTDHPRLASLSFQTSGRSVELSEPVSSALRILGYEERSTLFMTLLSVLKITLHGFTGRTDIRVGTLVATRSVEQVETLIGLFANTLILRTDLAGDPMLRSVLQRVRDTVLEALEHQDLPFEALLKALERERKLERDRLFRVLVIFGTPPAPPTEVAGLTVQELDFGKGLLEANLDSHNITTFDLVLTLTERSEGVTGSLVYKRALFSSATMTHLVNYFQEVAECLASLPDSRLSELPRFARS